MAALVNIQLSLFRQFIARTSVNSNKHDSTRWELQFNLQITLRIITSYHYEILSVADKGRNNCRCKKLFTVPKL